MTDERAAGAPAPSPQVRPSRAPRQAPGDLTFELDPAYVEARASHEPDWLAAARRAAFARFQALPVEGNRLYTTYLDLRLAQLEDVTPWPRPATKTTPDQAVSRPAGTAGLASLAEDRVEALDLAPEALAAGVILETLAGVGGRDPLLARRLLADPAALPADDKLAQLTLAGWNQGIVLHVPAGVRLADPIVLRWRAGAPGHALLTRTIVDLGAGASATILEEMEASSPTPDGAAQALFSGSLELHLGPGSELAVASIQDLPANTVAFQQRQADIGEGASLHWALAQLGGRLVRSRVDNHLTGDRSSVEQVEIVFGDAAQLFDLTSFTTHIGRNTTGNLLSKGALKDAARTFMKGLITIEKSAVGTDSFLGEFGMNLSKAARAVAIPSLEIDQPDCRRAAHSSSVGPIDETQLFYLESRGIDPDEARKFIVLGFLEPVVARVPLADAQERLRELLEAKWAGRVADASAA
jgi:Fe-S cluster assembly scaffold protein SufB